MADWLTQLTIIGEVALAILLGGIIGIEREVARLGQAPLNPRFDQLQASQYRDRQHSCPEGKHKLLERHRDSYSAGK